MGGAAKRARETRVTPKPTIDSSGLTSRDRRRRLLKRHSAREESVRWDSREHADAAAGVIGPQLQQHLSGSAQGAPDIRLFEVLAE